MVRPRPSRSAQVYRDFQKRQRLEREKRRQREREAETPEPSISAEMQQYENFLKRHGRNVFSYTPQLYEEAKELKAAAYPARVEEAKQEEDGSAASLSSNEDSNRKVDLAQDGDAADVENADTEDSMNAANLQLLIELQNSDNVQTTQTQTTPSITTLNQSAELMQTIEQSQHDVEPQQTASALAALTGSGGTEAADPSYLDTQDFSLNNFETDVSYVDLHTSEQTQHDVEPQQTTSALAALTGSGGTEAADPSYLDTQDFSLNDIEADNSYVDLHTSEQTQHDVESQQPSSSLVALAGSGGQSDAVDASCRTSPDATLTSQHVDTAHTSGSNTDTVNVIPRQLRSSTHSSRSSSTSDPAVSADCHIDIARSSGSDTDTVNVPRKLRSSTRLSRLPGTPSVTPLNVRMKDLNLGGSSRRRKSERIEVADQKATIRRRRRAESDARIRAEQEAKEEEERRKTGALRFPTNVALEPLTDEWARKVANVMGPNGMRTKIETGGNITLSRTDLDRVLPQQGHSAWLNDDVINAYLNAIVTTGQKERHQRRNETPRVAALTTFWYTKITKDGPESTARWTRRAGIAGTKLLDVERLFIPVNLGNSHWTLCVVSPTIKRIDYYDSLGGSGRTVINNILRWIKVEVPNEDLQQWQSHQHSRPCQTNSSDCGVFCLTTSLMIMKGVEPTAYTADLIPLQRQRIVAEFLNGGLFDTNHTF